MTRLLLINPNISNSVSVLFVVCMLFAPLATALPRALGC